MVCTAFVYFPETKRETDLEPQDEADNTRISEFESPFIETHRICDEPFYFSYQDRSRLETRKADLRKWMSQAVTVGLAEWAQRL